MKAILLIDMPKSCWACPLWDKSDYADECEAVGRKTHDIDHGTDREEWCPLKPLPHKLQADRYTDGYKEGFNACLKEITNE